MPLTDSPRRFTVALLVAWAVSTLGCGPSAGDDGPHQVTIYDQNNSKRYAVVTRQIETLDSPVNLTGDIAKFRGSGDITINNSTPETPEEYEDTLSIENDKPVRTDFARKNGRLVPMDFHSMVMFSMYHHLERANDFFTSLGLDSGRVGKLPVHYNVKLQLLGISLLTDNAAYSPTEDLFLVPPRFLTRGVPLAANRGIVVHEYSHAVFNRVIHNDSRAPPSITDEWPQPAKNRLTAINEGLADIFAGLQTDNANFINSSISEARFDIDRDLSKERHYTQSIAGDIQTASTSNFNPYELGAVIASTLWAIRQGNARGIDGLTSQQLGTAILDAMTQLGNQLDPDVTTAELFNLITQELPSNARRSACQTFRNRLDAIRQELTCDAS